MPYLPIRQLGSRRALPDFSLPVEFVGTGTTMPSAPNGSELHRTDESAGGTGYYRRVAGAWVQVGLLGVGGVGGVAGVTTFNGRAGLVVPAQDDYTFAQLASKPTTLAGYGITDAAALAHTHSFASLTGKPTTVLGYGISDAVATTDARLSDARTPLAHTQAASTISDATTAGKALLTAADVAAQRTALALGGAALLAVGTATGTVAAGDDARLTNARTPNAHASTHASGGSDPVTPAAIGAASAVHSHSAADIASGQLLPARGGTGADLSAAVAGSWPMVTAAGVMRAMPPIVRATDLAMTASSTGVSLGLAWAYAAAEKWAALYRLWLTTTAGTGGLTFKLNTLPTGVTGRILVTGNSTGVAASTSAMSTTLTTLLAGAPVFFSAAFSGWIEVQLWVEGGSGAGTIDLMYGSGASQAGTFWRGSTCDLTRAA